jgi:hypothetical protein
MVRGVIWALQQEQNGCCVPLTDGMRWRRNRVEMAAQSKRNSLFTRLYSAKLANLK